MVIGKTVEYSVNNEKMCAEAVGIDCDGGLLVKGQDGRITALTSGSIIVKN